MSLPKNVAKTTITIYNFYEYINGKQTFVRTVLDDVYYRDNSIEIQKTTGNEVKENIIMMVNYYSNYISKNEWHKLSSITGKFTFDNSVSGRQTMIVLGTCPYTFGDLTKEEMSLKIKDFMLKYPEHRKVKEVNEAFYGSHGLWHLKVRC
jgi:hypothetical protein